MGSVVCSLRAPCIFLRLHLQQLNLPTLLVRDAARHSSTFTALRVDYLMLGGIQRCWEALHVKLKKMHLSLHTDP